LQGRAIDLLFRTYDQGACKLLEEAEAETLPGKGRFQKKVRAKWRHEQGETRLLRSKEVAAQKLF
jgi:hypothetical protein